MFASYSHRLRPVSSSKPIEGGEARRKSYSVPRRAPGTLLRMDTMLRIRESSPSELLADRLEREARTASPEMAADYLRQAELLRSMMVTPKVAARNMFADNFLTHA